MVIFGTNMILRYLLNDNEEMAGHAEKLLNEKDAAVTVEVIAEVVYVLKGVYELGRAEIAETVRDFLDLIFCSERDTLETALDAYARTTLDFVDCVLYGYHAVKGAEIATFDRKLLRLLSEDK